MASSWRSAASVIIVESVRHRILLAKRASNASFMPNTIVFPGGTVDKLNDNTFPLDKTNEPMKREDFHLKITALRELFEECGIIPIVDDTGRRKLITSSSNDCLAVQQDRLHDKAGLFVNLFTDHLLDLRLDTASMKAHSNWLTPADYIKRFDTFFYLISVEKAVKPRVYKGELSSADWNCAKSILDAASKGKYHLAPPQFYELTRLSKPKQWNNLESETDVHNSTKICPQMVEVDENRTIGLLNGDQAYIEGERAYFTKIRPANGKILQPDPDKCIHRFEIEKHPKNGETMKMYL
ncbi:hypothetical protein AB6A40_001094 [Gnathostoma spinigerum]|uniref:Nudix hydrolase domain-containing protein n=1 Tax=Gnathostoma spinigerum TaxID=75299 RepID=A0ABD6EDJ2_9BILA